MDGYCSRHLKQKCMICFEQVRSKNSPGTKSLSCGHAFHMRCILDWFVVSSECPVCRRVQVYEPLLDFKDKVEDELRKKYKDLIRSYEQELRDRR